MNIFATSPNPVLCAITLDNKRLVKMVLETCQLLSTAITVTGGIGPYKPTHVNHPCSIWVRENRPNYNWTLDHFKALLEEYTLRYGRTHKCHQYLELFQARKIMFKPGELTLHPNCTTFKEEPDVYKAYGLYMHQKWDNDKVKPSWDRKVSISENPPAKNPLTPVLLRFTS